MRLVLVPGFSQTASAWQWVTSVLGDEAEAVPVEVPHEGDFETTAKAIGDIGGPAIYVGYSMGGRLALNLALDHPELVEGLVLISASPGIADHAARRRRYLDDSALADWIEANGRELFLDRWLSQPIFDGVDPALARRHRLRTAPAIAAQLRRLGQGVQPPLWDRLRKLDMPTLLIAGERDPQYVTIAAEMLAEIGLNANVEIIPDCTHALPIEWPGAIASLILSFLEAHPGPSTP